MPLWKSTRPAALLALASLLAALGAGCGITLDASNDETELFKDLHIEGDFVTTGDLTLTLEYARQYSVPVLVACELLAGDPSQIETPVTTPTHTPVPEDQATPTDVPIPPPQPTSRFKLGDILRERLPPNEEGGPVGEATPVPGTLTHEFTAPAGVGTYVVRCVTPDDQNNSIAERITVRARPTPTLPG